MEPQQYQSCIEAIQAQNTAIAGLSRVFATTHGADH